jgi:septum formation protein
MNLQFTRSGQPPPPPPQHIILASQSIGRRALLEKLGIHFRVVITRIEEDSITDNDPYKMLKRRAAAKADEVVNHPRVYSIPDLSKNLVIAADSMAVVGKKTYGKADDRENAKVILKSLMGKTHIFTTAICIVQIDNLKEKKRWEKTIKTKVTLRKMTTVEIDSYVGRFDFTRFAAGYAINEAPWDLVTKIDGSYTNVIGLPFEVLLPILRTLKIIL